VYVICAAILFIVVLSLASKNQPRIIVHSGIVKFQGATKKLFSPLPHTTPNGELPINQGCVYNSSIAGEISFGQGLDVNQEALSEMATDIAELLRKRSDLPECAVLTAHIGTLATGNGARVRVCVNDPDGNVLLSVSVELRMPQQSQTHLKLVNKVRKI
jgi:hypothetical protein